MSSVHGVVQGNLGKTGHGSGSLGHGAHRLHSCGLFYVGATCYALSYYAWFSSGLLLAKSGVVMSGAESFGNHAGKTHFILGILITQGG